jgi:hypothetical protein
MRVLKSIFAALTAAVVALSVVAALAPIAKSQGLDFSAFLILLENRLPTIPTNAYPPNATPVQGGSADVANASAVATLAGASGKTTYITHFRCTGTGATAAAAAAITVAGPTTSEIYIMGFVAGAAAINTPVDVVYSPPLPAAAANTAITVTMGAGGSGAAHAACAAEGFQL